MSLKHKTGKSPYIMLALGVVMGGIAVTGLPHLVPSAQAQQGYQLRPIAGITAENMATLRALDNSFASLAQYIEPSVVKIESTGNGGSDMLGRRMGEEHGVGTGVIYRPDGWIITNDHVVAGFGKVQVDLADGRKLPATVVHEATDNDIAVVKVDANNLPAAQFGDSAEVRPGQFAMAVGAPFDMQNTVTVGHISALGRDQQIPDSRTPLGMRAYSDMIQTDTPINMGNSGGPLINVDGQVIGINSAILSESGGSVGIGFAIPSNQANMIAQELINKGSVTVAFLGLAPSPVPEYLQKEKGIDGGALVADAPVNTGPAGAAGIQKGDIVTRVGTYSIRNEQDVRDAMFHYAPGTTVKVEVLRGTEHKTFDVKLGDKKTYDASLESKRKAAMQQQSDQDGNTFQFPPNNFPNLKDFGFGSPFGSPFQGPGDDSATPDEQPLHSGHARLGVTVENLNSDTRTEFNISGDLQGAVVTSVAPGSVADKLGITQGCVIQQVGGKTIHSAQDLSDAMKNVNWGESRRLMFVKSTSEGTVTQNVNVTFK